MSFVKVLNDYLSKNADIDVFSNYEFKEKNAIPTAEGIISILINELPITIYGMKIGVLGYGHISRALCQRLSCLGGIVSVVDYRDKEKTYDFDALINTRPMMTLDESLLSRINNSCLLIEVASAPFGIDFDKAEKLGFKVIRAPGLPGIYSEKTAALIYAEALSQILESGGK